MKRALRWMITVLAVVVVAIAADLLTEGFPLLGIPRVDEICSVSVEHRDHPGEEQTFTDQSNIELASGLLGYLRYSPLKGLSDDEPLIEITYLTKDGETYVVSANNVTVWWNGKPRALQDENTFVKLCTAIFFS